MAAAHVYVLREQAENFVKHINANPALMDRLLIIGEALTHTSPGTAQAMVNGLKRVQSIARSNEVGSTFDGLAQALLNSVYLVVGKNGEDCLGEELRHALTDILGLPVIPMRQEDPATRDREVKAFFELTGGPPEDEPITTIGEHLSHGPDGVQ